PDLDQRAVEADHRAGQHLGQHGQASSPDASLRAGGPAGRYRPVRTALLTTRAGAKGGDFVLQFLLFQPEAEAFRFAVFGPSAGGRDVEPREWGGLAAAARLERLELVQRRVELPGQVRLVADDLLDEILGQDQAGRPKVVDGGVVARQLEPGGLDTI